jgi:hypothetical protein
MGGVNVDIFELHKASRVFGVVQVNKFMKATHLIITEPKDKYPQGAQALGWSLTRKFKQGERGALVRYHCHFYLGISAFRLFIDSNKHTKYGPPGELI